MSVCALCEYLGSVKKKGQVLLDLELYSHEILVGSGNRTLV